MRLAKNGYNNIWLAFLANCLYGEENAQKSYTSAELAKIVEETAARSGRCIFCDVSIGALKDAAARYPQLFRFTDVDHIGPGEARPNFDYFNMGYPEDIMAALRPKS